MKERQDDYQVRGSHLKDMSDAELKKRFFELCDQIVDPLLDMAYHNTSKSIERSILLRMGFSSLEAKVIVDTLNEHNLLRKGAGHCVYKIMTLHNLPVREAGLMIFEGQGIEELVEVFNNVKA